MSRTLVTRIRFRWPLCVLACALAVGCDDSGGGSDAPGDAGDAHDGAQVVGMSDGAEVPDGATDGDATVPPDMSVPGDARRPDDGVPAPDMMPRDAGPPPPPVVINEVQCRGEEWVEVFNPTAEAVSLSRWVLTDRPGDATRAYQVRPGLMVPAGGFVVLPDEGELPFGVGCDGETLVLLDPHGREVDQINVEDHPEGASWGRLPDGADAWRATHPTPGAPNEATPDSAVWINEVRCRAPDWIELYSGADAPLDLSGWVVSDRVDDAARGYVIPDGVVLEPGGFVVVPAEGAELPFGVGCDGETLALLDPAGRVHDTVLVEDSGRGSTWGRLPDGEGAWGPTASTPGAPNEPVVDRGVRLNEIQCRGEDWVELHNPGAEAVELGGWVVADAVDDAMNSLVLPDDLVIEPGGFVLLAPEGGLPFGIGCAGDTVWLLDARGAVLDSTAANSPPDAVAWGRLPDGEGEWGFTLPTPGDANRPLPEVTVALNELQCRGEEWVELYNHGDEAVALGGWFVSDQRDDPARRHVVPDGTMIEPGGWWVLPAAGELPFGVGCDRDPVALVNPRGRVVDRAVLASPHEGATGGRLPDGIGAWVDTTPTRGAANAPLVVASVSLNEVQCRGETEWVELVNTGEAPVDLSGWTLAEGFGDPDARVEIEGGMLAPDDYFVVELGDEPPFAIGCEGDEVLLLDAHGVRVDRVEVGSPALLATWGRLPDAGGPFATTLPTPGMPNQALPEMAVELSEIDCHGRDWVELVNIGPGPADLTGWSISDAADGAGGYALDGLAIPAGEHLVVRQQDDNDAGFEFGISCGDETIALVDRDGGVTDSIGVPPLAAAFTWGRLDGVWAPGLPTPGEPNVDTTDPAAILYDATRVMVVDVEIAPEAWAELGARPREYVPVTFRMSDGDEEWEPRAAQIRVKGRAGSNRPLNRKPAFKLKFNRDDPEARFLGLKRMTLNNMVQDPSMIHEWTTYSLFRAAGVPAPRIGYAFLRINDEDWGLYLNIEDPDDVFLRRHFESTHHLYEGQYGQDLFVDHVPQLEMDEGPEEERDDIALLAQLLDAPPDGGFYAGTQDLIDWPEVILDMATEAYTGHWDGYAPTRNNYYLHFDDEQRLSLMPWGADQTLRQHRDLYEGRGRLLEACLADPDCRSQYDRAMVFIMQAQFGLELPPKIMALAERLRPWQERDVRKEYDLNRIGNEVNATIAFLERRIVDVGEVVNCVVGPDADPDGDGFICAADCEPNDPTAHPGAIDECGDGIDQDCNGIPDDGYDCPDCIEHLQGGHRYLVCLTTRPYDEVAGHCRSEGAEPVVINGAGENAWVADRATSIVDQPYWIGLTDAAEEGSFVWADGSELGFTNWAFNQPDDAGDAEDCVQFVSGGQWSDVACDSRRRVVCEDTCAAGEDRDGDGFLRCGDDCDDSEAGTNPGAEEVCGDGLDNNCNGRIDEGRACECTDVERGGKTYTFCRSGVWWTQGREFCQQERGADLVVLNDAEEDAWVFQTAAEQSRRDYWIGLSDRDHEGQFTWVDGAASEYRRWKLGQPDNGGGSEDCAHYRANDGEWNDLPCDFALGFICETP